MENITNISDRIKQFIDYKGFNMNNFSKSIGASNSYFNKVIKNRGSIGSDKLTKIFDAYPELNPAWLFSGEGEMVTEYPDPLDPSQLNEEQGTYSKYPLLKTLALLESNPEFTIVDADISDYYTIPKFKDLKVDFLVEATDDSMYPKYNSGDVLACRKITDSNFIQWNKVHLLITKGQGVLVKRLSQSESADTYLAISENKRYEPFTIPKQEILGVFLIVGSICLD